MFYWENGDRMSYLDIDFASGDQAKFLQEGVPANVYTSLILREEERFVVI